MLLDTIGDLASVYGVAGVAFIGGSLVPHGGHNPLEAARFGVPVAMGESYGNFREIVNGMEAVRAIRILGKDEDPGEAFIEILQDDRGMGDRGRVFFEGQAGGYGAGRWRRWWELMGA